MSKTEWTDETWNPVTGCDKVSPGCRNCYAGRLAEGRLKNRPEYRNGYYGNVQIHPDRLEKPLHWRKPRRVFVNSMSDLFHEAVPFEFIAAVFGIMAACPQHQFQVLTKRPERAIEWFHWVKSFRDTRAMYVPALAGIHPVSKAGLIWLRDIYFRCDHVSRGLPNVWIGVSAEDQTRADNRIPLLMEIPAAIRFLSCEPLLGPINFSPSMPGRITEASLRDIHWVIVGGESGPNARPMNPEWVCDIRDACQEADVPFFFKQWGEWFPRSERESVPDLVLPDDCYAYQPGPGLHHFKVWGGIEVMHKVGKSNAWRALEGETWDEYPEVPGGE